MKKSSSANHGEAQVMGKLLIPGITSSIGSAETRAKCAVVLEAYREDLLDDIYGAYCRILGEDSGRDEAELVVVCLPVRNRISHILSRYIIKLQSNQDYNFRGSDEEEIEYALRFVVSGRYRDTNSHFIVKLIESIVDGTIAKLTEKLADVSSSEIRDIAYPLIYRCFEDLWFSCVTGFTFQHKKIEKLLSHITETQERERRHISYELHDRMLQNLATISLKLQMMKEISGKDSSAMEKEISVLMGLVSDTIVETRSLCLELHDSWIERKGLLFSLKSFISRMQDEFGIPITLESGKIKSEITGLRAVSLFRIIQESLYNVGKHSQARQATVTVCEDNDHLTITVRDDGIGFSPRNKLYKLSSQGCLGLISMQERVRLLDGKLKINSNQGGGTKVTVSVPTRSIQPAH